MAWARLSPWLGVFGRAVIEADLASLREAVANELPSGRRTLELGCGPGSFADLFVGEDYVGIDSDRPSIDWARRHRAGIFMVCPPTTLEIPDERFDQVLVLGLVDTLPAPEARRAFAEVARVLIPGGRFLVVSGIAPRVAGLSRLPWRIVGGVPRRGPEAVRELAPASLRLGSPRPIRSGLLQRALLRGERLPAPSR